MKRAALPWLLILALLPSELLAYAPCWDAARSLAEAGDWPGTEKILRGFPVRDRACELLLAEALVHQEKHTWALEVLGPLVEADPRDAATRALLGMALLGMGEYETLVAQQDELPPTAPEDPWTGVIEQIQAAAEFRIGRDRDARRRLARLLRERPGHPFREEANRFMDLTWWYGYRDRSSPRLDVATGIQYDSNAVFEPDDPKLTAGRGAPAAWRGWLSASGRIPLLWEARTAITGNLGVYRSFHSTPEANDFNYTDLSGGATLVHRMLWGGADAALEVAWQSRIGFLDGGPLLPEPGFFPFLENHSAALGLRVEASPGLLLGLTGLGGYQRFAELSRNNWGGGGLLSLLWSRGITDLAFTASGVYRDAARRGYDRYELTGRLSLNLRLPWELHIGASLGGGYDDYLRSAGWFEAGPQRQDARWDAGLRLSRTLPWGLAVEAKGGWASRSSTVHVFEYSHWTAGLTLSWRVPW